MDWPFSSYSVCFSVHPSLCLYLSGQFITLSAFWHLFSYSIFSVFPFFLSFFFLFSFFYLSLSLIFFLILSFQFFAFYLSFSFFFFLFSLSLSLSSRIYNSQEDRPFSQLAWLFWCEKFQKIGSKLNSIFLLPDIHFSMIRLKILRPERYFDSITLNP